MPKKKSSGFEPDPAFAGNCKEEIEMSAFAGNENVR
jgi:hypothetical protein